MIPLPDALPGLDDLDDVTLHEPVTKENDMNEARASERADLVELRREFEQFYLDKGWHEAELATYPDGDYRNDTVRDLFACYCGGHLQGLTATAQEPAATASRVVSVMDEFTALAKALCNAVPDGGYDEEYVALSRFVQRLIPAPSVAEPAKCGTCDQLLLHPDEACPKGCTPVSAEQKCKHGRERDDCFLCEDDEMLQAYDDRDRG